MIRLMLDSLRRWWWVLALLGGLESVLGWIVVANPGSPFEVWSLTLALCPSGVLLGVDLQRGLARAVAVLPLTSRQIGRSWWLGAVGIPAVLLIALFWLGAALGSQIHAVAEFPTRQLAVISLFTFLWLGSAFASIYGLNQDCLERFREQITSGVLSVLATTMTFGSLLYAQGAANDPVRAILLIALGTLLTVAGWLRAERFAWGRAAFRRATLEHRSPQGCHCPPLGSGGVGFLLRESVKRSFSIAASAVLLMAALMWWQGGLLGVGFFLPFFALMTSGLCAVLVSFHHVMSILRELRHLRTLPISPHRLTVVLMGVALLPLVLMGGLVGVVAAVLSGLPAAVTIWKTYLFVLAPTSLCVLVGLWRGPSIHAYVCMLLAILGFTTFYSWLRPVDYSIEPPALLVASICTGVLLVAFALIRRVITHSSHAYRPQAALQSVWGIPE